MKHIRVAVALILTALTSPVSVHAQQGEPDIPPDVRAEGRRLQDEAASHVDAERWALAAETFQQLYDLARRHSMPQGAVFLWNRGIALMEIPGREAEARASFRRFLDESTPLTEDARIRDWRSTAVEHIAELDARIGQEEEGDEAPSDPSRTRAPGSGPAISPFGVIVAGVGTAALVASAITGGVALSANSDATTGCVEGHCLAELGPRADEAHLLANVTDGLLFGGLAIAAAGLVFVVVLPGDGATSASAACSNEGCAAVVRGSF